MQKDDDEGSGVADTNLPQIYCFQRYARPIKLSNENYYSGAFNIKIKFA